MSKTMNNPKTIATQDAPENTGVTPTQIADNADFPHSGLIKVLNLRGQGNYATSGFNATNVGATGITFAEGTIFRQGKKITVNQGSTQTLTVPSSVTNSYHLVVNQQGTTNLQLRSGGTANIVPAFTADDVIVAVLKHTGSDPMQIQYLTFNQTENSVSIARDDSGYTEGLTIQSNAGNIEIEAKETDKDIIFKVSDNGTPTEVMRVDGSSSRVGIGATAPTAKLEVKGDTTISRSADSGQTRTLSIEGARNAAGTDYARIDLENYDSHGPTSYTGARISAVNDADGVNDGSLVFSTNNANAGITERMRIDDEGNVGIGTNSPDTELHIAGDDLKIVSATNAKPQLTLENTTATSSAATPPTLLFKRSGTPAQSGDLGMLQFVGKDDGGNEHEYVRVFADMQDETNTTEDGRLIFNIGRGSNQANSVSNTEMLRLSGGEGIIFNHPKNNVDFEIRGDTNENLLFADAGNERIGILNGSPSATLDVTGSIAASTSVVSGGFFRSPRLDTVPSNNTSLTLTATTHAGRYLIYSGSSGIITLPATSTAGEHYTILNTTTGNITVAHGGNNINGAGNNITLGTFNGITCIAIGSNNWIALGV